MHIIHIWSSKTWKRVFTSKADRVDRLRILNTFTATASDFIAQCICGLHCCNTSTARELQIYVVFTIDKPIQSRLKDVYKMTQHVNENELLRNQYVALNPYTTAIRILRTPFLHQDHMRHCRFDFWSSQPMTSATAILLITLAPGVNTYPWVLWLLDYLL